MTTDQLSMDFVTTRARRTDSKTSHDAAKHARTQIAEKERQAIRNAVACRPMTAREVSKDTGIDYIEVQRRISECDLVKTDERRDGCMVWSIKTTN